MVVRAAREQMGARAESLEWEWVEVEPWAVAGVEPWVVWGAPAARQATAVVGA